MGISVAAYTHWAVSVPNLSLAIDLQYPNLSVDLLDQRHDFNGGKLKPPSGPGLGVEPKENRLQE
jgi:L-alanine-DL-glutamate epimerase-like enolase superfamily enzyme